jgi:tRNA (guanine37-N1)-methyltransferase
VTLFPGLIAPYLEASIIGRARAEGRLAVEVVDLRSFADDPRRSVDDSPYGGGAGMVLRADRVLAALADPRIERPVIGLSPAGTPFSQALAVELAGLRGFTLVAGRYEGFDARAEARFDALVSLGDFVLAGGELPALVVLEAVARLVPGVLGNEASPLDESFGAEGLLEHPQYTRPRVVEGMEVPEVLLSGDHGAIARWRRVQAIVRTARRRPDLLRARGGLRAVEEELLAREGYAELVEWLHKELSDDEAD